MNYLDPLLDATVLQGDLIVSIWDLATFENSKGLGTLIPVKFTSDRGTFATGLEPHSTFYIEREHSDQHHQFLDRVEAVSRTSVEDLTWLIPDELSNFSQLHSYGSTTNGSSRSVLATDSLMDSPMEDPLTGLADGTAVVNANSTRAPDLAAVSFSDDFESTPADFSNWRKEQFRSSYSGTTVNDPTGRLNKVLRVEYQKADYTQNTNKRSELASEFVPIGIEKWYGISFYVPNDYPDLAGKVIIHQQHAGISAGSAPYFLAIQNSHLVSSIQYRPDGIANREKKPLRDVQNFGHVPKGQWFRFISYFNWQPNSRGRVEVFLNGSLRHTFQGPIGYSNDERGNYSKIGLYASGIKGDQQTLQNYADKYNLYVDDYREGSSRDAVVT